MLPLDRRPARLRRRGPASTIRETTASPSGPGASTSSAPSPLTVPAKTSSPGSRSDRHRLARDRLLVDARPARRRPSRRSGPARRRGRGRGRPPRTSAGRHDPRLEPSGPITLGRLGRDLQQRPDGPAGAVEAQRLQRLGQAEQEGDRRRLVPLAQRQRPGNRQRHQDVDVEPEPAEAADGLREQLHPARRDRQAKRPPVAHAPARRARRSGPRATRARPDPAVAAHRAVARPPDRPDLGRAQRPWPHPGATATSRAIAPGRSRPARSRRSSCPLIRSNPRPSHARDPRRAARIAARPRPGNPGPGPSACSGLEPCRRSLSGIRRLASVVLWTRDAGAQGADPLKDYSAGCERRECDCSA